MRLSKQESAKRELVRIKMKEHGLSRYVYDGKVVNLDVTEKPVLHEMTAAEYVHDRATKGEVKDA